MVVLCFDDEMISKKYDRWVGGTEFNEDNPTNVKPQFVYFIYLIYNQLSL